MTTVAALDCGTNSVRLLVSREGEILERHMRITRLGQGVDATGRLSLKAVERTLTVLREYRALMDAHHAERVRMTVTSAGRDADNRDDLFVPAAEIVGAPAELLTGDAEGRLAFAGATTELDPASGPFLVVDIGGGSTEFVAGAGDGAEPDGVASVDLGCVRLTEKFLSSDPPTAEELSQAISVVHDHLDDVARALPTAAEAQTLVGLAGTVTTVAAVEMGLARYDRDRIHHFVLTRAAVEEVFRTLATEPRVQRQHNPGLEAARADVIVGGAAILVSVMRYFAADECLVSEADILDGLVMSLLGSPT